MIKLLYELIKKLKNKLSEQSNKLNGLITSMNTILILLFIYATQSADPFGPYVKQSAHKYCTYNGFFGQSDICKKYLSVRSTNKFPIIVGVGLDTVTGEIKLPVLNNTYFLNKKVNSFDISDQSDITVFDINKINSNKVTFKDPIQFLKLMDPTKGSTIGGIYAGNPSGVHFLIDQMPNGQNGATIVTHEHYAYKMTFGGPHILDDSFHAVIEALPVAYDPTLYNLLIQYWGTGVVLDAYGGGIVQQITTSISCYADGIDINNQAELVMLKRLYPKKYANVNFVAGFEEHARSGADTIFGGNPALIKPDQWPDRLKSFETDPVMVRCNKIIPLNEFVSDPTKSANIKRAIGEYIQNEKANWSKQIAAWTWNRPQRVIAARGSFFPIEGWYGGAMSNMYMYDFYKNFISEQNSRPFVLAVGELKGMYGSGDMTWLEASDVRAPSYCGRDSVGNVYARWDYAGEIDRTYNRVFAINRTVSGCRTFDGHAGAPCFIEGYLTRIGNPVRSGCSVASLHVKIGYYASGQKVMLFDHTFNRFCCIGCVPILNECDDRIYSCKSFSCNCPSY